VNEIIVLQMANYYYYSYLPQLSLPSSLHSCREFAEELKLA
jgi:hypothetical protein